MIIPVQQPTPSKPRSSTVYQGPLFAVEQIRWEKSGREVCRDVVRHPGAVVIVPRLDDGRIVFIRNFRIAADRRLWELPAGILEPGEAPENTARRELEEETGYRAGATRPLGRFYTTPGLTDELMHVFLAESLQPVTQRLEPWEDIEVSPLAPADAKRMIMQGEIVDGKSIAAMYLLWLIENRL